MLVIRLLLAAALIAYPFVVYIGLQTGHIEAAACFIFFAAVLNAFFKKNKTIFFCAIAAGAILLSALLFASKLTIKFYPVIVTVAWLASFASSLSTTPMIEIFARLREPNLDAQAIAYCRNATIAWCIFFIFNGLIALDSALFRSDAWWALYNGLISYCLIALMFALEWCVRLLVKRRPH